MNYIFELCDLFKEPVYLRIQRYKYINGSACGGILSFSMTFCLLFAAVVFFTQQLNPEYDIIRQIEFIQTEWSQDYEIDSKNFLPIISMHALDEEVAKQLDIFKDGLTESEKISDYMNVDVSKLRSYFDLRVSVRNRTTGESVYSIIPFRQCTKEDTDYDFNAKNMDETKLLCPDFNSKTKELFTVKNFYTNLKHRISFSVDVAKCSNFENPTGCKSDNETIKIFDSIYFQLIVIT